MTDIKEKLIVEQYKQASEEYRREDNSTWWTFAIILTLNGALAGSLNLEGGFFPKLVFVAVIGIVSTVGGILVIARTGAYQKARLYILEKIQSDKGIEKLYFDIPLNNYAKDHGIHLGIIERIGGRLTLEVILGIVCLLWVTILTWSLLCYAFEALYRLISTIYINSPHLL